jgi:hypothetical protein
VTRLSALAASASIVAAGCAGDLGAGGRLPACGARPIVPPGFAPEASEKVELADRVGIREEFRGPGGRRLIFHLGVRPDVERGLPKVDELPLATVGSGRLRGSGEDWVFAWEETFPCSQMAVVGSGFEQRSFVLALGHAQVIPFEAEGGGKAGEGIEEILEEAEGAQGEEAEQGVAGATAEWVAVFDAAADPGELDPGVRELRRSAGTSLSISPASCWRGLAPRLRVSRNTYVAAVIAGTEGELDFVVDRVGRIPQVRGLFPRRCPAD